MSETEKQSASATSATATNASSASTATNSGSSAAPAGSSSTGAPSSTAAAASDSLFESNFSEHAGESAADSEAEGSSGANACSASASTGSASSGVNTLEHNENAVTGLSDEEIGQLELTIRSLVTSKQAGIIIGKDGKNVADLREQTGVKAGVSKSVSGVPDRVLTVTGTLDGVAKAYSMAAATLLATSASNAQTTNFHTPPQPGVSTIKLLISHHQMGTIIGLQGAKIKSIQENTKVRMVASKELLPNSTERTVEVQGTPEAIQEAVWEIGRCLLEDASRSTSTIYYNPQPRGLSGNNGAGNINVGGGNNNSNGYNGGNNTFHNNNNGPRYNNNGGYRNGSFRQHGANNGFNNNHNNYNRSEGEETIVDEMSISADMVGCIIGRGGSRIADIRRSSGARISIAKEPHDNTGERRFTIIGTREANQKALALLFNQLESEKKRRTGEDELKEDA